MTVRGVIIGLVGVALLCGLAYFNDTVLGQTHLVGNHLPISVFGGLVFFLLLINPLLARVGETVPLRGKELALILAMMMAAATIPGSGMMRTFSALLMMPHHLEKTEAGWRQQGVVQMLPDRLLADVGEDENALNDFMQGMARGGSNIRLGDIPWEAWSAALWFWVPMIFSVYLATLGLALIVHRQWAHHEQLPYPIVQFVNSMLPERPGLARGKVFASSYFWLGLGLVAVIHLNNYAVTWFPELVRIPLVFDFRSLLGGLPEVRAEGIGAFELRIYFSMVAIAYFLAADVGLAIGLAPMLYPFIAAFFTAQGISLKGGGHQSPEKFVVAGAFFGMFLTILYTGRYYYQATFRRALGIFSKETVGVESVWGARLFMLAMAFFVAGLMFAGLDAWLSLMLAFVFVVFYVVMGRIIAETGLFFMQPWWIPGALLVGLLGAQALGPEAVLLLFFISVVFLVDPREAIMPFLVNGLKLLDVRKMPVGRSSSWIAVALAVGLLVAIPATLWFQYNNGVSMRDGWSTRSVPSLAFSETMKVTQRLDAQGILGDPVPGGLERIAAISPDPALLIAFGVGLALVLLFNFGRLRFAKWPIHPVCFIVFCSYAGTMVAFSFLLGWAIKLFTTKYGGEHGYHALKPLMFGLIAGDMLGGGVPILIGWLYHFATGEFPRPFSILPG